MCSPRRGAPAGGGVGEPANPGHREGFGKSNAWMWRELRQDARFRELVDAT